MEISVIIPAFNEEERIEPTLRATHALLASRYKAFEILVVDDGSSDGTVGLVHDLGAYLPELECLATRENRGKGHAVRLGMTRARGQLRVMCDADGSMPADELPKLLAPIVSGQADIAIGSRYAAGATSGVRQPLWRRLWSRLVNAVVQQSLVAGIRDTQCGFKAFTASAANEVFGRAQIDGWAFDLEALALAKRLDYVIEEVGVVWSDDGRSRVSPLRDFVSVVREWRAIRGNFRRGAYGPLQLTSHAS